MISPEELAPLVALLNALEPRLHWRVTREHNGFRGTILVVTGKDGRNPCHSMMFSPAVTLENSYPLIAGMWRDAQDYIRPIPKISP